MVTLAFAVSGADNPQISLCVQPGKNIGDRLRPAKSAHSDFLVTCTVSRRLGAQSDGLGILAGVPSRKLERSCGMEGIAFASRPPLSFHGFEFGSVCQRE
jgi:hypothetical protein